MGAVEAALRRDGLSNGGEAARYEIAAGAGLAHCPDQRGCAAGKFHLAKRVVDEACSFAGEEGETRVQGLLEIQLAAHGTRRDRQDVVGYAGDARHVVQRLRGDDGAVHVGDQQPLFPVP